MSASTKVFVVANKDLFFDVARAVTDSLSAWQRGILDKKVEELGYLNRMQMLVNEPKNEWMNGMGIDASSCFQLFHIYSRIAGYTVKVTAFPDCSCDTDEITTDHTFTFSSSAYGEYIEQIMPIVISVCQEFGDTYYMANDSVCDNWVKQ